MISGLRLKVCGLGEEGFRPRLGLRISGPFKDCGFGYRV